MIQRVLSFLVATAFLIAVFLFPAAFVALAITAGLCFAAWAWWRGRRGARVIEGGYRIIESK
jgi:hypothetical protein